MLFHAEEGSSTEGSASVLCHRWLSVRKSLKKNRELWGVGIVICREQGADCLHMVQLMPLHPKSPPSLTSFRPTSRLVLPFWYWLTQVSLDKRPLKKIVAMMQNVNVAVVVVISRKRINGYIFCKLCNTLIFSLEITHRNTAKCCSFVCSKLLLPQSCWMECINRN